MTRTKTADIERRHQVRMARISKEIKRIAFKKKQQITKVFQEGDEVEVASQIFGYIGSYYTGTIISYVDPHHYRVKYKTLWTDDESEPLEEIVVDKEIRPAPPIHQHETSSSEDEFCVYDMVDVYSNDGWWFGVISGKVGEEYYVYFPTTAENIAYTSDMLRVHQEWSNGEWITLPTHIDIFDLY